MNTLIIVLVAIGLILLVLAIIGKKEIKTSIDIQAPPVVVWRVLTDFENYEHWNPFIKYIKGDVAVGNKIRVNAGGTEFRPNVLVYQENKELRWLGRLMFPGIFDGEHLFQIIDQNNGSSTLKHEEKFKGILVGLMAKKLEQDIKPAFENLNKKLKEEAEKINGQ